MNNQEIIRYFIRGDCKTIKDQLPDCELLHRQLKGAMKGVCSCKHNSIRQKYKHIVAQKLNENKNSE